MFRKERNEGRVRARLLDAGERRRDGLVFGEACRERRGDRGGKVAEDVDQGGEETANTDVEERGTLQEKSAPDAQ